MKKKPKNPPRPTDLIVEQDDAVRIGRALRSFRKQRHLKQSELAQIVEIQPAQLCNTEKGNNLPSLSMLRRICDALGITINDLVYPPAFVEISRRIAAETGTPPHQEASGKEAAPSLDEPLSPAERPYAGLIQMGIRRTTHPGQDTAFLDERIIDTIQRRITDYMLLENMCGVSRDATIPLRLPFPVDAHGATQLASKVRMHCGVGSAIVFDTIELLENNGLRILFSDLPPEIESVSFYDSVNTNGFIVVSASLGCERQLFRIMFELANIYLHTRNNFAFVHDSDANRHFAKRFAAEMLMPRDAVLTTVTQLGIRPDQWNDKLVLRVKAHFGVFAESFVHRLDELNLLPIDGILRETLLSAIQRHYTKTDHAEPGDCFRQIRRNARFDDLLFCAKLLPANIRDVRDIELRVKKNYPPDMRIAITPPPSTHVRKTRKTPAKKTATPRRKATPRKKIGRPRKQR